MKRPAKVTVLGKAFRIKFADKWPTMKKDDVGESDPVSQTIYIKNGQTLEAEQDTVIHEYVEAAGALLGFGDDHSLVIRITTMIHQMVKDNPGLMAYLRSRNERRV